MNPTGIACISTDLGHIRTAETKMAEVHDHDVYDCIKIGKNLVEKLASNVQL